MSTSEMKDIRPSLKSVAPLTAWNVRGFGILNTFLLGVGLYFLAPYIKSFHAVGTLPIRIWTFIFLIHGLFILGFLKTNNWRAIKTSLLIGCFIKIAWVLQFVSLSIQTPTPLILSLMGFGILLLYIQIGTYINFTPKYHARS